MQTIDLYALRKTLDHQKVTLCFNGPTSQSLIEEIGKALKHYLNLADAPPGASMDVFSVYIEMTQNIRHYAALHGYGEQEADCTVVIARQPDGRYAIAAGNLVQSADGQALAARVDALSRLDKPALKAAYKEQLRKPRIEGVASGAGLGLLEIARKASAPLATALTQVDQRRSYFSLFAVI